MSEENLPRKLTLAEPVSGQEQEAFEEIMENLTGSIGSLNKLVPGLAAHQGLAGEPDVQEINRHMFQKILFDKIKHLEDRVTAIEKHLGLASPVETDDHVA